MERIGIRELRQHASRWVRRASAGESFEVTDRGRPVARLVPPASDQGIARLRAEGRTTPPTREPLDDPPLQPKPGVPLPSQILEAMRADER
jgi:prevent-host-death family protein